MAKEKAKRILTVAILALIVIGAYLALDRWLVLDRTDKQMAEYKFGRSPADAEVEVEGTGLEEIEGEIVFTKLKVFRILKNNTPLQLEEGATIRGYEYFDVFKNRQVGWIPLIPGRSIYSMGTSYKRVQKGERRTVRLGFDQAKNRLWIKPDELIE